MASESPLSAAVAGRDIAIGISEKSSPGGAGGGGGDEICKNGLGPPPSAVGGDGLLDLVADTEDKVTLSSAVAGDEPNVGSGCNAGVRAGISSDGSYGHSSTDSVVIESDVYWERPTSIPYFETIDPFLIAIMQRSRLNLMSDINFHCVLPDVWMSNTSGSNGHSYTDSAVIESYYPGLFERYSAIVARLAERNRALGTENLEIGTGFESPIDPVNIETINRPLGFRSSFRPLCGRIGLDIASLPISMGGTPVNPPVNAEGGHIGHMPAGTGFFASLNRMVGGITVIQTGNVEGGRIPRLLGGIGFTSLPYTMGGTAMFQPVNVEGGRIRRLLASIGFASPISAGNTLIIRTGNLEAGYLLTGSRFGAGRSDITPMNDDFRMSVVNEEPQTVNYPPPLDSGDNSHLVRPLEQHFRSNRFVVLFVTSEILGMVFEIIYQESRIMSYFFIWIVCCLIAMYAARLLARIEGGMANREQFAVYLRCFSFLLLEMLQYWGIHQGNFVTALKIILRVTGAVIGWWVVGVLQTYMDAFGMHLPLRRRDD